MSKKTIKRGRGRPPVDKILETVVIAVPEDKIQLVEKILKHKIETKQIPTVRVRVPADQADLVREALKKDKNK